MEAKIAVSSKREKVTTLIVGLGLISLFAASLYFLKLDVKTFVSRFESAGEVVPKFFALDFSELGTIISELFVSLCMAVAGLALGFVLSIPLSFLGASNTTPHPLLAGLIKGIVGIVRAVPALIWILIVVASLGFGNTAGVVGLIFPTTGYLTKSFISSIEEQDPAIIETMKSTGAGWLQLITEGLLPGLTNPILSWTSIRLESNIAESISLGMVGAGGIGMVLTRAIGKYEYAKISTIIVVIFVTMITVELLIGQIKKAIR
ncbi:MULTISPECIES: PhnE/PtxC family ABC transporter permease [Enterococcus]|uniref:Phosphonate ABC transporter, permease PhnE n=1 Tax=Candidatus Enterococcus ferrettii TaxID=2815324 RepID=A0ABV0ENG2_9ENTE|nr:phosphate/phosphonate ABC transporter permease [Enterococcus sp. 665A]MBO1339096.1 phosphate/phosphonate ABC transporter permease [Enterococcus sp. 665A]